MPIGCEVFCDLCGDCMECYYEDPCFGDGDHSYVEYDDDEDGEDDD